MDATGSVQKRSSGKYAIVYRHNGRQHWKTIGTNKKEAKRALVDVLSKIQTGEYSDRKIGFSDLVDKWLESLETQNLKPSTIEFYANISAHLKAYFKDQEVKSIGAERIQAYIAQKCKTLSNRTAGYHLGVLKQVFKIGQAWKYTYANPCEHIRRPKAESQPAKALAGEELARLLAGTDGQTHLIIKTALYSGLRAGELCGLRWDAIDLVEGAINVLPKRNYVRGQFVDPKSEKSIRKVVIPPELVNDLAQWKDQGSGQDNELVFSKDDQPLDWTKFLHGPWKRAIMDAGIENATPHHLRHTYTSILLAHLGAKEIAFISEQLGHGSIDITLKVYSHMLPDARIGAGARIGAAFDNTVSCLLAETSQSTVGSSPKDKE